MALSACAGKSGDGGGGDGGKSGGGTLIYGAQEAPQNWNPQINAGNGIATGYPLIRVFPSVFKTTPKFQLVRDEELTSSVAVTSQKPFTVVYKLNPKAVWSDGRPITADDFKLNWQLNDTSGGIYHAKSLGKDVCQSIATGYNTIKTITGTDNNRTVTAVFKQPYPDWKSLFTGSQPIIPAYLLKKSTAKATCQAFNAGWSATTGKGIPPVSGGPFKISSASPSDKTFTEIPNDKYWGKKPSLSKIVFKYIGSNANTTVTDMQNKEVQMVYPLPQPQLVKQLNGLSSANTEINFGLSFDHIDFNVTNPYLKDQKVRQAIALALDRKQIVAKTVGQVDSSAKVLNNRIFVSNQPGYKDTAPSEYNSPNPQKALSILKGDGYTYSGGKLMKNGKQVTFLLATLADNQNRKNTALLIQDQMAKIGIKINLSIRPSEVLFGGQQTKGSISAGDYDFALYGWIGGPTPTSQNTGVYSCVPNNDRNLEQQNSSLGCDKAAQKLIDKVQTVTDQQQIIDIWNQVDSLLWKDVFTIPLFQVPTILSVDKKFKGVGDNASVAGPFWNAETWTAQ